MARFRLALAWLALALMVAAFTADVLDVWPTY